MIEASPTSAGRHCAARQEQVRVCAPCTHFTASTSVCPVHSLHSQYKCVPHALTSQPVCAPCTHFTASVRPMHSIHSQSAGQQNETDAADSLSASQPGQHAAGDNAFINEHLGGGFYREQINKNNSIAPMCSGELSSCVKIEAVLGSPSLIVRTVYLDV